MFLTFKKWSALYLLSLVLLFVGFAVIWQQGRAIRTSAAAPPRLEEEGPVLIIDPGHGGRMAAPFRQTERWSPASTWQWR